MNALSRNIVFALIITVLLVSFTVSSGLAAGPIHSNTQNLEASWKNERTTLQRYQFLQNRVAKWISEWQQTPRSRHQKAKKNGYANDVYLTVQKAEILTIMHPGFDAKGKVIDQTQATQSVEKLAIYLQKLHTVFYHKFHHRIHHKH